jgi:hypothetical protein
MVSERIRRAHTRNNTHTALAHFDTSQDLTDRIKLLFSVLDTDDSKTLSFKELQLGLRKLKVNPPIRLSDDDWEVMTLSGMMTNSSGELDEVHFEMVMRRQLKLYVQRQLANSMELVGSDDPVSYFAPCLYYVSMKSSPKGRQPHRH